MSNNFLEIVSQGFPNGDAREQGIHAAVKAIEKYDDDKRNGQTTAHTLFFRDGAKLAFVLLSDEDEFSTAGMLRDKTTGGFITPHSKFATRKFYNDLTGDDKLPVILSGSDFGRLYNYRTGTVFNTNRYEVKFADNYILGRGGVLLNDSMCPQCPPEKFQNFVRSVFGSQKNMVWNSIIKTENNCSSNVALHPGYVYEALSNLTGGIVGDVCVDNYTDQLKSMGHTIQNMNRVISLECEPVDSNWDGREDMEVLFKAPGSNSYQPYSKNYRVHEQKLIFDDFPDPGQYQLNFNCAE